MHRLGIDVAPFDDTMLISYVLGAGTGSHDIAALAERWLGHEMIPFKDVVGSGRNLVTFDLVDIERATTYATEGVDIAIRLWRVLKPRLVANGLVSVYERLERPLVPVLARMEERGISVDRQMLARLVGRVRAARRRTRGGCLYGCRRALHHRLAKAARRHSFRQDGPSRRLEDQIGPVVDHRATA